MNTRQHCPKEKRQSYPEKCYLGSKGHPRVQLGTEQRLILLLPLTDCLPKELTIEALCVSGERPQIE